MVATSFAAAAGLALLVSFAVNTSALVLAFLRLLQNWHASRRRALWTVSLAAAVLLFGWVVLGTAVGFATAFGAVGGESADPSQKARVLAEGISQVMNCLALGVLAVPLSAGFLIYTTVRARRERLAARR